MKSAVDIEKENRKQEQTAIGLAAFTTIVAAVLSYITGHFNIGGSIFFGAIVSVAEAAIYYYLENREDAESRKIYAVIGTAAIMIVGVLLGAIIC